MLATAFHVLHFRQFMGGRGPLSESLENAFRSAQTEASENAIRTIETHAEYETLITAYMAYTEKTLRGEHGSTAQYWMIYVQLVELFLRFNRSCRTNDVNLFITSLGEMCPIFFFGNRPNYSRWMVKYYHNLMNIDTSHPGLRSILENGAFSIRRSTKSFSRNAVDITLEQTINADAASRSTGISAFSQSESAKRRWMVTRSVRSAIIGSLLGSAGLKAKEDVSKSLRPYRIKKDNTDLNKIIETIHTTMNPFAQEIDDNLYCLTTGVKVNDEIKEDLLFCLDKGKKWHDEFVKGCFKDPQRFEKPIQRRKIKNFASAAEKSKIKTKDLKVVELQGTRDLFGRLLYLSTMEDIDVEKVFQFPLTPVPLSLAHLDGTLNKTDKSKLVHRIEKMADSEPPNEINVVIVDAMFYLHSLISPPNTYGQIAEELLQALCSMAPVIHFVCDSYVEPSIKDIERNRRGATETTFAITGPDQRRPRDWQAALKSPSFNRALFRFLATEWKNPRYAHNFVDQKLIMGFDETCHKYTSHCEEVRMDVIEDLKCQHEEADTRMIFHLYHIANNENECISVRCNDTDVLILLLYHFNHIICKPHIWMDIGLSSNNTRRFINIRQLVDAMGSNLIDALPGFHAFTGSDTTAAFINKGKLRPFDLLEKSDAHVNTFSHIGQSLPAPQAVYDGVEKYVCAMYGKAHMQNVDNVRYAYFQQNYAPKRKDDPLEQIKGINPSSMPPCKHVLSNKVMRANYVAHTWRNAHLKDPSSVRPEGQGWIFVDNKYHVKWFDCDQVPQSIRRVLGMETSRRYMERDESEDVSRVSDDSDYGEEWD
ncbi:MAG: hypothetical protein DSY80_04015 [Desulfocapsa sp.]|nr:MAG: hypothetical protein DSY80_04015 [Desulfocapsa sp.]